MASEPRRGVSRQVASAQIMLRLLLHPLYAQHVDRISEFLEQNKDVSKRGVSLDEWTMLLQFCREMTT